MTTDEILTSINARAFTTIQLLKSIDNTLKRAYPPPPPGKEPDTETKRGAWCDYVLFKRKQRLDQIPKKDLERLAAMYQADVEKGQARQGPYSAAIEDYIACRYGEATAGADTHGSPDPQVTAAPPSTPDDDVPF